jgi:hypothetical protein
MPINLKSPGGGGVTLNPPSTNVDLTLTLPSSNGTVATTEGLIASTGAASVGYSPASGISSTTVQGAITEVANSLSNTLAGNKVFFQNSSVVSSNYTIPAATNAGTFGDVAIANGITVTITNGSSWTLV